MISAAGATTGALRQCRFHKLSLLIIHIWMTQTEAREFIYLGDMTVCASWHLEYVNRQRFCCTISTVVAGQGGVMI